MFEPDKVIAITVLALAAGAATVITTAGSFMLVDMLKSEGFIQEKTLP